MTRTDFDVLIIGSGFGGSASALRLVEKGYRVGVLEAGRRFADEDFARTTWDLRRYVFAPRLGCYGIQRLTATRNITILSGAGVGGGSLVYGNTMYEAPDAFFDDPNWRHITDWKRELAPWYDQAKRMFGVTTYDRMTDADEVLRRVAVDLGMPQAWNPTPVALVLGEEAGREVADPYFGGVGPRRRTCLHCGECLTGCRHNAKNSLTKNYLYLAEQAGAEVVAMTTVTEVRPKPGGGYLVSTRRTGPFPRRGRRTFAADQVIFSAAALGTQTLLHQMRASGDLPGISPRLGELTRTNSEAGVMIRARRPVHDFSKGAAITCSLHVDENTHAEPARYGSGSTTIALGLTPLVDPVEGRSRLRQTLREIWRKRSDVRRLVRPRAWPEQTLVIGVMQNLDNSLTTYLERRGRRTRLATKQGIGAPNPIYLPEANALARQVAEQIDGIPAAGWNDALDRPMTGHFLGGCAIGATADSGVVDPYHRLFGHPGLHVIDGSNITANLGVNPSLTILALAERAISLWPNKGELDQRPALGAPYRRVPAVPPRQPAVPAGAPAALRVNEQQEQEGA